MVLTHDFQANTSGCFIAVPLIGSISCCELLLANIKQKLLAIFRPQALSADFGEFWPAQSRSCYRSLLSGEPALLFGTTVFFPIVDTSLVSLIFDALNKLFNFWQVTWVMEIGMSLLHFS